MLKKAENLSIKIPVGTIIGGDLIFGRGPGIDVKVMPIGTVATEIQNEITSAGINQTRHQIILVVNVQMSVITGIRRLPTNVSTTICIAETVIVGKVPESYTNIDAHTTQNKTGDGIITANPKYVPILTVADCVPIYFYEPKSCVFGVVHSGWKGTGIIQNAIELACKNYNLIPKDFLVAIGPHINDCCYKISQDRAEFFLQNYGCNSVINRNNELFLSLTEANLFILEKIGINKNNIVVT